MRRIRVPNIRLSSSERTFLDENYTAGSSTSITVTSSSGFAANDYAIVGDVGEEKTEAGLVTGTTGSTSISLSAALTFSHNKGVTIYRSEWDQIALERKLTASTTWTSLSTFNIQWDKKETLYVDSTGTNDYDYRFRFYNSTTGLYSEYSPTVAGSGFTRQSGGRMIINVRKKIRDPQRQRFTDAEILLKLQDGQTDIQTLVPELWFLRVDTYEADNGIAAIASTARYSLSTYTDLNFLSKIIYKYVSGTTEKWELDQKSDMEFNQYDYNISTPDTDDNAQFYKLLPPDSSSDQGYFKVYPMTKTTGVGTFYPTYFRKFTNLNDISDETELPFPEILEDYAAWKLHDLMGNTEDALKYKSYYYGPNSKDRVDNLTGIALLEFHNDKRNKSLGYGRRLWNYKGARGRKNYFPSATRNRDYIKENYF